MELRIEESKGNGHSSSMKMMLYEGETLCSKATFFTRPSRYHDQWITAMTVAGVATEPEYRRGGCVRKLLEEAFSQTEQRGWAVSLLHPFSFSYYRRFGYEKIADHLVVEFPISKLEYFPRCPDFVKLAGGDRIPDVLKIFDRFCEGRGIMFRRFGGEHLPLEPKLSQKVTYIRYRGGEPVAYVTLNSEKVFRVNRMADVALNVFEMAFTDPESLRDIFGFLRMFEGENERVIIHNCAMIPEVDMMLRHYVHTSYVRIPDLMGRVMNSEKMLLANTYPKEAGHFRIAVEDSFPTVRGVFEVEYGGGAAQVKRLAEDYSGQVDLICEVPAFTQMLYGYYSLTPGLLSYMEGVKVTGDPGDFLRAFPKSYNGLFEHF